MILDELNADGAKAITFGNQEQGPRGYEVHVAFGRQLVKDIFLYVPCVDLHNVLL